MESLARIFGLKMNIENIKTGHTTTGKLIKDTKVMISELDYNIKHKIESENFKMAMKEYLAFKNLVQEIKLGDEEELKKLNTMLKQFLSSDDDELLIERLYEGYVNEQIQISS